MSKQKIESEIDIVRNIYRDGGKLADDLRAKCRYEQMAPIEVIREWPSFVEKHRKNNSKLYNRTRKQKI